MRKLKMFLINIVIFHTINLLLELMPNHSISNKIRGCFYKFFLKKAGKNLMIAKGAIINCKERLIVGNNVYIAHNVWINAAGGLTLCDNVIISPQVVISTTKHLYENGSVSIKNGGCAPIVIKEGSWIASNCTLTMGITIGQGCIIAANSSVIKNIPDYTFAGGVPAKPIKALV